MIVLLLVINCQKYQQGFISYVRDKDKVNNSSHGKSTSLGLGNFLAYYSFKHLSHHQSPVEDHPVEDEQE